MGQFEFGTELFKLDNLNSRLKSDLGRLVNLTRVSGDVSNSHGEWASNVLRPKVLYSDL